MDSASRKSARGRLRVAHVLDREDLEDPEKLRPIAAASGLTPEAFRDRYGYLTES